MATVTISAALPEYFYWADFFEPSETIVSSSSATTYAYEREGGYRISFGGSGLSYDPDDPSVINGGTITSVTVRNSANVVLFTITGLSTDATDIYYRINGYEGQNGDGFDAISQLLVGNDTINGSENGDDISAGTQEGNDTIFARGGDDFVKGDRGNDTIDGGAGFDTLSYQESINPTSGAYRGISLDVVAGTVIDAWGNTDTISNFEGFRGSSFADIMKGSDQDIDGENWMGLRGADNIDGRGGFDDVRYDRDFRFGGMKGIRADLAAGTIYDGWGQKDTVSNIEGVIGTKFADTFLGSVNDDEFEGLGGLDTYNGGSGGRDIVRFNSIQDGGATHGVTVNLSLSSGQITDDGFGNVETTVSIEGVQGSSFDDTLTGNSGDNLLRGREGNDTLNGLGGVDIMRGDLGDDIYFVDNALDVVLERAGGGLNDRVSVSTSYTLAAGVEVERLLTSSSSSTASINLTGNEFAQIMSGNNGANRMDGRLGADTMTGRGGNDSFIFSTALGSGNVDVVTDFANASGNNDLFRLSKSVFAALTGAAGTYLTADQFVANAAGAATNTLQHILYETDTGKLFYDADGNKAGGVAAIHFATISNFASIAGTALAAGDFYLV